MLPLAKLTRQAACLQLIGDSTHIFASHPGTTIVLETASPNTWGPKHAKFYSERDCQWQMHVLALQPAPGAVVAPHEEEIAFGL